VRRTYRKYAGRSVSMCIAGFTLDPTCVGSEFCFVSSIRNKILFSDWLQNIAYRIQCESSICSNVWRAVRELDAKKNARAHSFSSSARARETKTLLYSVQQENDLGLRIAGNVKRGSTDSCIMHNTRGNKKMKPIKVFYFFPFHDIKDSDWFIFLCLLWKNLCSLLYAV